MSSNNISVLEGFDGMVKLKELKLYGCQLARIQNLAKCVSLAALHLEDNYISIIEGLDNLRSLEYLSLASNQIEKIGPGLTKLTKLKDWRAVLASH
eukprot:2531634-Amphidinium_carterae.1